MVIDRHRLRALRFRAGLTQLQVAEKIFVMPSTISRMERGKTAGSLRTLKKLAELYDVPMDSLLLDDPQSNVG